jgi:hypothetical protein
VKGKGKDVEWEVNDLRVMSQILNSIEPNLYNFFAYTNTAKELLDSIFKICENANNFSRVFEIQQTNCFALRIWLVFPGLEGWHNG